MVTEDSNGKKRKGATHAAPKPKKQKKVDEAAAATKKSAKALNAAVKPIDDVPVNVKVSRKRAADLFDDQAPAQDKTAKAKQVSKKAKVTTEINRGKGKVTDVEAEVPEAKEKSKRKIPLVKLSEAPKEKKSDSHTTRKKSFLEQPVVEDSEEDEEDEEDDQTAALLAGFESDNDEEDPEEDVELDTEVKADIDVNTRAQLQKAPKKTDEPGVIYVGRIPHGFYESQMKAYFKQFGTVTRLRVSRNKKTGAAKHYAFVEFASAEVADIVARTMNNYLMFGHILQCRVVPTAQVDPKLFNGANSRFKRDPRNKKEGAAMEHGAERAVWEKRVNNEQKKRAGKNKMLKDEIDYEYTGPAMKAVADVPKIVPAVRDGAAQQLLAEAAATDPTGAVHALEPTHEQPNTTETTVRAKAKKPRKSTKSKITNNGAEVTTEKAEANTDAGSNPVAELVEATLDEVAEAVAETQSKKSKKRSKSKANTKSGAVAVIENIESVAKAGAEAVTDATNAVVDKVKPVIDAGADAIISKKDDGIIESKPKKSKKRSKSKPTTGDEAVIEEVGAIAEAGTVDKKVEAFKEKKKKGKKGSKTQTDDNAEVEVIAEQTEADTEVITKEKPVKEKKAKKAKKSKADSIPETEEAPVQSIVGDVVDKAKSSTKKIKSAKKAKAAAA